MVETFLFEFNGLSNEENRLITEPTMESFITMERLIAPLLWIYLSKSPLRLKSLIDSASRYVIFFSYFIVQILAYIFLYTLLKVYHQGYILCNLFFLIFFHFFIMYIIFIEKKCFWRIQNMHIILWIRSFLLFHWIKSGCNA